MNVNSAILSLFASPPSFSFGCTRWPPYVLLVAHSAPNAIILLTAKPVLAIT